MYQPSSYMHLIGSWAADYMLRLSFLYLRLGWRLELYGDDEYNSMFWVMSQFYQAYIRNTKERTYAHLLQVRDSKVSRKRGKRKKASAAKLKPSDTTTSVELKLAEAEAMACLAMFHVSARSVLCMARTRLNDQLGLVCWLFLWCS